MTISTNQAASLKAAITPDHHSRWAYSGQVTQRETVTIIDEDGTAFEKDVSFAVSWESISKVLDLINKRAGI